MTSTKPKEHYSYRVYARRETAEGFEQDRFSGPVGDFLRDYQEGQLRAWLGDVAGTRVLDIGAGTGRTAIPLAAAGASVVAADASEAMLEVTRRNAEQAGVELQLDQCDVMRLQYEDGAFDTVLCFRVLMHVVDWRLAVRELCRCSAGLVLLDFPPRWALAGLQVPVRHALARVRPSTKNFRLLSLREIRRELAQNGFVVEDVDKLWVLPIAVHKLIGSMGLTQITEGLLDKLGLRGLVGAPVTVLARRRS